MADGQGSVYMPITLYTNTGHHNVPANFSQEPSQSREPRQEQVQTTNADQQAQAQDARQEPNDDDNGRPQPRANAQPAAGNNSGAVVRGGNTGRGGGARGGNRGGNRGGRQGRAEQEEGRNPQPARQEPSTVVRELGDILTRGNRPQQQQQGQGVRQLQQAAGARPANRNQQPQRSRRQQAEEDLRVFLTDMTQEATIYNIIHIFSNFLGSCYAGQFDRTHLRLWGEVIHGILPHFTEDQRKVLRKMII